MRTLLVTFFGCISCILWSQDLNTKVVQVANQYSGGGYKWSSTGVPKSLYFKNVKILEKSREGTFCSGYTFAVAFDVLNQHGLLDAFGVDVIRRLQRNWYGTDQKSAEKQCLYALKLLDLGKEVDTKDARPGDFVQFWRNNKSGHSVIFLDWVKDNSGNIIGIKYRSTQRSTNGIGDRTETIGTGKSDINFDRIYIVRLKG